MANPVQIVSPLDYPAWDEWVGGWNDATPFHGAAWARTLTEAYGFQPRYAVILEDDHLRAVLPMMEVRGMGGRRRGVSLPFSDFCGALVRDTEDASRLMAAVRQEAETRHWRSLEYRGAIPDDDEGTKKAATTYLTHEVDLTGTEEDQWKRCRPAVRRATRKARDANVEARTGCDDEAMNVFYHLFTLTRRRHGLPPPPLDFFRLLQRHVLKPGAGTIVSAWRSGRALAASIFLRFGSCALFKYGASDERYQSARPNDLVMWEGLRWCRAQSCRRMSMGKTREIQEGLRRFKLGWGAQESVLNYYTYVVDEKSYVMSRDDVDGWYNHVFRRMPLPLLRWTGRLLYHHAA